MFKPVAKSAVFVPLITTFAPESVAFEVTVVNVPAIVELDFTLNTAESTSTFEVAVKVIRSSEVISNSPSAGELISNAASLNVSDLSVPIDTLSLKIPLAPPTLPVAVTVPVTVTFFETNTS